MTSRVHSRDHSGGRDPSVYTSNPQDLRFDADEYTVNTYTANKNSEQDPPMNAKALVVYEPDYAKPDPEGETAGTIVLALTNGEDSTRNYAGEPITKAKLEPEEILSTATPRETSDPSVAPQPVLYGVSGDASDDEDEYDQYGFRRDQPQIYAPKRRNKRSEELEDSLSFATEDPEDERRRARKSRKKKKKETKLRGDSRSTSSKRHEESNFTLESSEREKAYRQNSGVDSVESEVGSIELESRASA